MTKRRTVKGLFRIEQDCAVTLEAKGLRIEFPEVSDQAGGADEVNGIARFAAFQPVNPDRASGLHRKGGLSPFQGLRHRWRALKTVRNLMNEGSQIAQRRLLGRRPFGDSDIQITAHDVPFPASFR